MGIKKRRITAKDHDHIAEHVRTTLADRKADPRRKAHETIWEAVDKQVAMKKPKARARDGRNSDWHNNVELGLMADALEITAADIMRIAMPNDRNWFQPHIEFPLGETEGGTKPVEQKKRESKNNILRSLMAQQHADTGNRDRIKLCVKESLVHGAFVGEVRFENFPKFYEGGGREELGAPVIVPHSMWNSYPDPSQSVFGTGLFYTGSMIITSEMKWPAVFNQKGWINLDKLDSKGQKNLDAKVTSYWGDIYIPRGDGDIFVPNQHVILVEETLVFLKPFDLPFSPILYSGVEKDDIRDAYFTSQLIKRSPNAQAAAHLFNKALDAADLATDPPIAYDSLDPRFAAEGGPLIFPGSRIPTRGSAKVVPVFEPNSQPAFEAYLILKQSVEQGTGVDAVRAGVSESVEQTAQEVQTKAQRAEVRTIDHVSSLERQVLRPFLYMQHELNKKNLKDYPVYNDDPFTPDFIRLGTKELNDEGKVVHFEVTGARTVLGEERRRDGVIAVTTALLNTEEGAAMIGKKGLAQVARDSYADFGAKDPERYLPNANFTDEEEKVPLAQVEQLQAEAQAAIQELQGEMQKIGEENSQLKADIQIAQVDLNAREEEKKVLEEQIQLNKIISNGKQELERVQKVLALKQAEALVDGVEIKRFKEQMLFLKQQLVSNAAVIKLQSSSEDGEGPEVDGEAASGNIDRIVGTLGEIEQELENRSATQQQKNELIINMLKEDDDKFGALAGQLEIIEQNIAPG